MLNKPVCWIIEDLRPEQAPISIQALWSQSAQWQDIPPLDSSSTPNAPLSILTLSSLVMYLPELAIINLNEATIIKLISTDPCEMIPFTKRNKYQLCLRFMNLTALLSELSLRNTNVQRKYVPRPDKLNRVRLSLEHNIRLNPCSQIDCRRTGLLQESLLVSPHRLSPGLSLRLLLALGSNPWPPTCAHPLPLLSLVQCWGLGRLEAWGASLLLPSHISLSLSPRLE